MSRNHSQRNRRGTAPRRSRRSNKQVPFGIPRNSRRNMSNQPTTPFVPPEDWYEPFDEPVEGFDVVHQDPGAGYIHVLTEDDVRQRLEDLPEEWLEPLQVVQFSRLTRKKRQFPCYGMQWGPAIYLYPVEETLVEYFGRPPRPAQLVEARMYGGKWEQLDDTCWTLTWTERQVRDFFLNNVLIHELGHLLDDRNRSYEARERYAEWFSIEYGYRPTRDRWKRNGKPKSKSVTKRHHR